MIGSSRPPVRHLLAGAALIGPVLLGGVAGCGASEPSLDGATALEYHYGDASVPPEYHRSYTLTLATATATATAADGDGTDGDGTDGGGTGPATGSLVVDSYGDVLHDVEVEVDAATWSEVLDGLDGLDRGDVDTDDGCSGGTSRSLAVRADDEVLVERTIQVCGGSGAEEADELDGVMAPLLADLDLDALLE